MKINGLVIIITSEDQNKIATAVDKMSRLLIGLSLEGIECQMTFKQVDSDE